MSEDIVRLHKSIIRQKEEYSKSQKIYKVKFDYEIDRPDDFDLVDVDWFADWNGKDRAEEE